MNNNATFVPLEQQISIMIQFLNSQYSNNVTLRERVTDEKSSTTTRCFDGVQNKL